VSSWGAPGCAQGREEGTAAREQLLATARRHGGSGQWRRDVEREGGVQRGVESGGAGAGAARGVEGSGAGGSKCSAHGWRGWRGRAEGKRERERGTGGRRQD
jgi:hypothetical protein